MQAIKMIVRLALFLLILNIFACANSKANDCSLNKSCLEPWGSSTKKGTSQSMKFDYVLDEFIKDNDPRIKSLIIIAKENPGSKLRISYFNHDGQELAERLCNIFKANNLLVGRPSMYDPNSTDISSKILVEINFLNKKLNSSSIKGT